MKSKRSFPFARLISLAQYDHNNYSSVQVVMFINIVVQIESMRCIMIHTVSHPT